MGECLLAGDPLSCSQEGQLNFCLQPLKTGNFMKNVSNLSLETTEVQAGTPHENQKVLVGQRQIYQSMRQKIPVPEAGLFPLPASVASVCH